MRTATHQLAARSGGRPAARGADAGQQAFWILRAAFTAAPIAFGLDKFLGLMTDWPQYLAPWINDIAARQRRGLHVPVGAIEIVAGVLVALKPRYGAPLVAAWLGGIIVNLLTLSGWYDIALRDFGLLRGRWRSHGWRWTTIRHSDVPSREPEEPGCPLTAHVIAGGGLAGAKAAETLREEGYDGRARDRRRRARAAVRAPAAVQGLPARGVRARGGLRPRRGLLRGARRSSCGSAARRRRSTRRPRGRRSTTASASPTSGC